MLIFTEGKGGTDYCCYLKPCLEEEEKPITGSGTNRCFHHGIKGRKLPNKEDTTRLKERHPGVTLVNPITCWRYRPDSETHTETLQLRPRGNSCSSSLLRWQHIKYKTNVTQYVSGSRSHQTPHRLLLVTVRRVGLVTWLHTSRFISWDELHSRCSASKQQVFSDAGRGETGSENDCDDKTRNYLK